MSERSAGRSLSELVAGLNAGQHLALDAIVAYVDGELDQGAHGRATEHLACCTACAAEVGAQRQMRFAVQSAAGPVVPDALLAALRSIPETAVLPPPPDAIGVGPDGNIMMAATPVGALAVSLAPAEPAAVRSRRPSRQLTGTVVSGMVLGALILATAGGATTDEPSSPLRAGPQAPLAAGGPLVVQSGAWGADTELTVRETPISVVPGGWAVGLRQGVSPDTP